MSNTTLRIAMWSGPRNISTALMRSWENRADTTVSDEPFYAYYLRATGLDHPGAAEIMASDPTDWRTVVDSICGPAPDGRAIWYQKHMTHHILPEVELDWLGSLVNCFLIREPREMITSYISVRPDPTLQDLGLLEQRRLFDAVRALTGSPPPVIDARDVLLDPARVLSLLCAAIDVPYTDTMLHWPAGPRASDGVWAKYWYDAVEASTGFSTYRPKADQVPERLLPLLDECNALYDEMVKYRLY